MSPGLCPARAWASGLRAVKRFGFAADGRLFDDGDHVHRDHLAVGEPQGHLGAAGQRFGLVPVRRPGPQPPIQFVDPVG